MTTKRNVILLTLVATLLALVGSGRPWVTGSLNDGVVQASAVSATGNQVLPGYFGIALVAGAGVIAAATAGKIIRWPAIIVSIIASVLMVFFTVRTLLEPSEALKSRMAEVTGHTGEALARGTMTGWYWLSLFASILMVASTVLGLVGVRRWRGLSSRYDNPTTRTAKEESDWDLMTRGVDPTVEDGGAGSHQVRR